MNILVIVQKTDLEHFQAKLFADLSARASHVMVDVADEVISSEMTKNYEIADIIFVIKPTAVSQSFEQRIAFARSLKKPIQLIDLDKLPIEETSQILDTSEQADIPESLDLAMFFDMPDWLREASTNSDEPEALNDLVTAPSEELPDWLTHTPDFAPDQDSENAQSSASPIPSPPSAPAPASPIAQPIRLSPPAPAPLPPPPAPIAPAPVSQPPPVLARRAESPGELTPSDKASGTGLAMPTEEQVFFTAYYPREIQAQRRYGLYVYAHLESALAQISHDVEKFKTELGDQIPAPKTAKKSASLKPDTPIMITPECDENAITFDPPSLTKKWEAEWKRFEFDFKPSADLIGETISGRVMVHIYGVEVATIKFAFEIAAAAHDPSPGQRVAEMLRRVRKENPLASAKFASSPAAALYHRIFVSYSRKDRPVAESYRLAQLAMGNDVFMDTYSIRTGENWQAALAKAIDSADIFQLFWSENAAASPNVRDEWEYALHYKCAESDCATFFRPVYWVDPMPAKPPAELSHLNFRYVPMMTMPSDPKADPTEAQDGSVI